MSAQIHLDVEVDERQLKIIVEKLHKQNQTLRIEHRQKREVSQSHVRDVLAVLADNRRRKNTGRLDNLRFAFTFWRVISAPLFRIHRVGDVMVSMKNRSNYSSVA